MRNPRVLITIVLTLLIGACAPEKKISGGVDARQEGPAVEYVGGDWTPERLHLECSGPQCRPQVGLLISSRRVSADRIELRRCTASLIAPDRILTSAHCVVPNQETNFILSSGRRKVGGVEWQTAGNPDKNLAPDLAVLKLETPFADVVPLRVATGPKPTYKSLSAAVVNATADSSSFRVDPLTCAVRRHERFYPFDIGENPNLIYGFDCTVIPGNSGGPLFGDGDEIQAVVQATVSPSPTNTHRIGIATNVRCFALNGGPAAPCLAVTVPTIDQRAQKIWSSGFDRILKIGADERASFPTEMKVVRVRLKDKVDGKDAIETIDDPVCIRPNVGELKEIKFLSELVLIDTDQWGNPRTVVADRRLHVGRVVSRDRDFYKVEITWLPPFGTLETPEQHPSVRRGSPFNIELHGCPR